MDKNTRELLKERFLRAIKKSFRPCPLIGDRWFKFPSGGKPADLQFNGCGKLAKAMGHNVKYVAQLIIKNLYLTDLNAAIEITPDSKINIRLAGPGGGKK